MTLFQVTFYEPFKVHGDTTLAEMFPNKLTIGVFVEAVHHEHAIELARDQVGVDDDVAAEARPLPAIAA